MIYATRISGNINVTLELLTVLSGILMIPTNFDLSRPFFKKFKSQVLVKTPILLVSFSREYEAPTSAKVFGCARLYQQFYLVSAPLIAFQIVNDTEGIPASSVSAIPEPCRAVPPVSHHLPGTRPEPTGGGV